MYKSKVQIKQANIINNVMVIQYDITGLNCCQVAEIAHKAKSIEYIIPNPNILDEFINEMENINEVQ